MISREQAKSIRGGERVEINGWVGYIQSYSASDQVAEVVFLPYNRRDIQLLHLPIADLAFKERVSDAT
jgi:hypothetical protein